MVKMKKAVIIELFVFSLVFLAVYVDGIKRSCGANVNDCDIGPWMPWGRCNQRCGGGTTIRRKPICCNVNNVHSLDQCISYCNFTKEEFQNITTESKPCGQTCYWKGHFNITENKCDCINGTWGRCCEHQINECQSHPCKHGRCYDRFQDYHCYCTAGFYGKQCDHSMCEDKACQNNATCGIKRIIRNRRYVYVAVCHCTPGFHGDKCQYEIYSTSIATTLESSTTVSKTTTATLHSTTLPPATVTYTSLTASLSTTAAFTTSTRKASTTKLQTNTSTSPSTTVHPTTVIYTSSTARQSTTVSPTKTIKRKSSTSKLQTTTSQSPSTTLPPTTVTSTSTARQSNTVSPTKTSTRKASTTKLQTTTSPSPSTTLPQTTVTYASTASPSTTATSTTTSTRKASTTIFSTKLQTTKSTTISLTRPPTTSVHQTFTSTLGAVIGPLVAITNKASNICSTFPCVQGTCLSFGSRYLCYCVPGFIGRNCDVDRNDCETDPCSYGQCVDKINDCSCYCNVLFKGKHCANMKLWAILSVALMTFVMLCLCCCCMWCVTSRLKRHNDNVDENQVVPIMKRPLPPTKRPRGAWTN